VRRRKDVVEPVEDDSLLAQCRMVEFHLRGGAVRGVDARGRRAEARVENDDRRELFVFGNVGTHVDVIQRQLSTR